MTTNELRIALRELGLGGAALLQCNKAQMESLYTYLSRKTDKPSDVQANMLANAQAAVKTYAAKNMAGGEKVREVQQDLGMGTDSQKGNAGKVGVEGGSTQEDGGQDSGQDAGELGDGDGEGGASGQGEGKGKGGGNSGALELAKKVAEATRPFLLAGGPPLPAQAQQLIDAALAQTLAQAVAGPLSDMLSDAVAQDAAEKAAKNAQSIARSEARSAIKQAVKEGKATERIEVIIRSGDEPTQTINIDGAHYKLSEILELIQIYPQSVLVVGPKGSGKTTLATQAAQALGVDCCILPMTGGVTESSIYGRRDPLQNAYITPKALMMMENGGLLCVDEYDAADPNALLALNSALANRVIEPPQLGRRIDLHSRFYIMLCGNTWGRGYSAEYAGRSQQDGAFLDRNPLSRVEVDYDPNLEARLCPDEQLRKVLLQMRENAQAAGITGWGISTRAMVQAEALRKRSWSVRRILDQALLGLSVEEQMRVMVGIVAEA